MDTFNNFQNHTNGKNQVINGENYISEKLGNKMVDEVSKLKPEENKNYDQTIFGNKRPSFNSISNENSKKEVSEMDIYKELLIERRMHHCQGKKLLIPTSSHSCSKSSCNSNYRKYSQERGSENSLDLINNFECIHNCNSSQNLLHLENNHNNFSYLNNCNIGSMGSSNSLVNFSADASKPNIIKINFL